jgi:hypothetical protein
MSSARKALCATGRSIRRSARDIERYIGREAFIEEVHRRGFRAIENAGQIVIFCNREPVRILRPRAPLTPARKSSRFLGKLQFSDAEISRFPRLLTSPTLQPDPVPRPHRQERDRHRLVAGDRVEPERRTSSASRSGPSIIANPAPGQTRAPAENGMKASPLTGPAILRPPAPRVEPVRRPRAACAGADARAITTCAPQAPSGRETAPPAWPRAPSSAPADRAAAPRERRRASGSRAMSPGPAASGRPATSSATRSCHSG